MGESCMMHSGAGDEGGEGRAAVMSANSLWLTGGPSLQVSSRLSSLRHQRDQRGGSRALRKTSNCPNHRGQARRSVSSAAIKQAECATWGGDCPLEIAVAEHSGMHESMLYLYLHPSALSASSLGTGEVIHQVFKLGALGQEHASFMGC